MVTYVLVHGGGHGGWCYQRVARPLRAAGHEVYAPTLSGCGDRARLISAAIDLDTHITDVVELLRYEDLSDVILVGHSYGGMVITGIADRAAERIGKLVYLDAANPKNGESLADVSGFLMEMARSMGQVIDGVELVLLPDPAMAGHYGITDPVDAAWLTERLTPHPWKCFEQKLRLENEVALWAIPQFHIVCASTVESRDPELIERARAEGRLWVIDTGHDLMITEPQAVADSLLEVSEHRP
jgi:pimeloyl-ACP methyl ester carboxylesterase